MAAEPLAAPSEVTNRAESMDEWELPRLPPPKGIYATFYTLGHSGLRRKWEPRTRSGSEIGQGL
jgi:hypothetical protein